MSSWVYCSAQVLQAASLIALSSTPQNMEIEMVFVFLLLHPARPNAVPQTMTAERATSEAFLNSFFFILLPLIKNRIFVPSSAPWPGKRFAQFGGVLSPPAETKLFERMKCRDQSVK